MMKHIGKMKNNGARIVVAYRTLPGDSGYALVIGTGSLGQSYHDTLMELVDGIEGQQANELAEVLAVRKFPDGSNMLQWLHSHGQLKKVPTSGVIMTPTTRSSEDIPLDQLNMIIAEQKGVALDELAIHDDTSPKPRADTRVIDDPTKTTSASVNAGDDSSLATTPAATLNLTPTELRSRADALFKQAQQLRKQADSIDPPKKRTSKNSVAVEAE
jgi:hypothetical protein